MGKSILFTFLFFSFGGGMFRDIGEGGDDYQSNGQK